MSKKILAMLLAVLMLVSLMTACSDSKGGTESKTDTQDPKTATVDLNEHREVTIAIGQNTFITDYEDNTLTKLLEDKFNCDITMEILPAGNDGLTKLQLMINGGDKLPDVFSYGLSTAYMYEYGSGGTFLDLAGYYENENVMPYFNAIESEEDKLNMISSATSADGGVYCLTMFQPETWNLTPYRTYINTKWLENLDLETPETVDEMYDVLKAFATEDPNGNGVTDEIPVFTNYVDGGNYGCNVILSMINYFTYVPGSMSSLTVSEDGKTVIAPQVSDGWKEAVTWLHDLYEAGAITDSSFIYGTDTTGFKANLNYQGIGTEEAPEGKSINIVGFFSCGSNSGNFQGSGQDLNVNFLEYRMIAPMDSDNHEGTSPFNAYNADRYWCVTEDAKDPAFCVLLGDYFYDRDMSIYVRFGQKDVDWTSDPTYCKDWYAQHTKLIEDAGYEQTKLDYDAWVVKSQNIWSDNTNHFWHNQQPRYMDLETFSYHWGTWTDPETFQYYYGNTLGDTSLAYFSEAHPKYYLPMLTYTDDEQSKITEFQVAFPDEVLEWTMKFITGELKVDADWDSYVKNLNDLGLQTYLDCAQAAYQRTVYYSANFG